MSASVIALRPSRPRCTSAANRSCASISSLALLTGDALLSRWDWLYAAQKKWDVSATTPLDPDSVFPIARVIGAPEPKMRAEVESWERRLRKRDALKGWLAARGLTAETAEDAALLLFDLMRRSQSC
jgi:hypothetical protein